MREIKFRAWLVGSERMLHNVSFADDESRSVAEYMQYTGLKDKNGEEIYEGDIYRHKDQYIEVVDQVEWLSKSAKWNIDSRYLAVTEVIGNIYENPELPR